jgi:hypothetical protein
MMCRHGIAGILLKVALNTKNQSISLNNVIIIDKTKVLLP